MATKRTPKVEETEKEILREETVEETVESLKGNFIVLHGFTDLEDENYEYKKDDCYPRNGYKPSEERVKSLSSFDNAAKYPIIGTDVEVSNDKASGTYR